MSYGESPARSRNPSPPKEVIGLSDSIGGTAFSKHWLFTTLMKLIKVIEDEPASTKQSPNNAKLKTEEGDEEKDDPSVKEISSELQDELCELWDMSMDEDVAKLLDEFKAVDILTEVITKSNAPRATEIAIGVLGNMACTESVCDTMKDCSSLVKVSLDLMTNPDAPTLTETTRFLSTVLSNKCCRETWLTAWKNTDQAQVCFILSSSVNKDLIRNTAELLDSLLDMSDSLCASWSNNQLLTAILEALKQVGSSPEEEAMFYLLHSMQLMTTQDEGVKAVSENVETTTDYLLQYLLSSCEDEIVNLEGKRAEGMASAMSVLDTALTSSPVGYSLLFSGEKCIRCVMKVIYACDKECAAGDDNSTPDVCLLSLREVLYTLVCDTFDHLQQEEIENSQTDDAEDKDTSAECQRIPSPLKYMNFECERPRMVSLVKLILDEGNDTELLERILSLCERFELNRLVEIISSNSYDQTWAIQIKKNLRSTSIWSGDILPNVVPELIPTQL